MKKIIRVIVFILCVCVDIILLPISLLMLGVCSLIPDSKAEEMGKTIGKLIAKTEQQKINKKNDNN
ncbi:MAG: hypothetical protein PHX21_12645 [bacterium]|nr:hypothetical protein [bacterium]